MKKAPSDLSWGLCRTDLAVSQRPRRLPPSPPNMGLAVRRCVRPASLRDLDMVSAYIFLGSE